VRQEIFRVAKFGNLRLHIAHVNFSFLGGEKKPLYNICVLSGCRTKLEELYHWNDRCQWPCGLRHGSAAAGFRDCGFKSLLGHGCLSVANVVCCQIDVSATS
jgi:hypothetical protein